MTLAEEDFGSPPTFGKTKSFVVDVKIQEHPGKLKAGYTPLVLVRTAKAPCKMTKINWKVTKANQKLMKSKKELDQYKEQEAKFVQKGDLASITFAPQMPFVVSKLSDCEGLGRVAVLESNSLVMIGKITDCKNNAVKTVS